MTDTSELKQTPLVHLHQAASAKLVPFAGWLMPVQYSSIIEEHLAVRNNVGLFDVSHMGEIAVRGPQAREFLNYLLTNDLTKLTPGQALYSPMCNPAGGCVDDLLAYCIAADDFLLCVNASNTDKNFDWIQSNASGFDVSLANESPLFAQLALQGPGAPAIAAKIFPDAPNIARFHFQYHKDALWSRTGYTGEDGFEIYGAPELIVTLARTLTEEHAVPWIGLGARDSLRLEAGYSLYGHEIDHDISPLEAGLRFAVKLKKSQPFIGQEPLQDQAQSLPPRKIIHFKLSGRRIARQGTPVTDVQGNALGQVVSGTHSPVLNQPIGAALVDASAPDDLMVDIRGTQIPLLLSAPPLFK